MESDTDIKWKLLHGNLKVCWMKKGEKFKLQRRVAEIRVFF